MESYLPVTENLQKLCARVQRFATLEGKVSYLEGVLRHSKLVSPEMQEVAADLLVHFYLKEKESHYADYDKAIHVYERQNPEKAAAIAGMAWGHYRKAAEAAYSSVCSRDYGIYESHSTFHGCGYEDVTTTYRGENHQGRKQDLERERSLGEMASAYQKQYEEMKETLQKKGSKPFPAENVQRLFSVLELVLQAAKPEGITNDQMRSTLSWLNGAAEIPEGRRFDRQNGYRDQWEQKAFELYENTKKEYDSWESRQKEATAAEKQGSLFNALAIKKSAQESFNPVKAHTEGLQFLDRYNQHKRRWTMTFIPS